MDPKHFDLLIQSAREMVEMEAGEGNPPARQTTYLGKVLCEVKVNGKVAWSIVEASKALKDQLESNPPQSPAELIRLVMDTLNQTDEGMAQILGVPVGTLRGWKSGRRKPDAAASKLLRVTARRPDAVIETDAFEFA